MQHDMAFAALLATLARRVTFIPVRPIRDLAMSWAQTSCARCRINLYWARLATVLWINIYMASPLLLATATSLRARNVHDPCANLAIDRTLSDIARTCFFQLRACIPTIQSGCFFKTCSFLRSTPACARAVRPIAKRAHDAVDWAKQELFKVSQRVNDSAI